MTAFKAPPKPLLKRLSENLALQMFMVFIIGLAGFLYIRKNSKDHLQPQMTKSNSLQMESDEGHQFGSQQAESQTLQAENAEAQSLASQLPNPTDEKEVNSRPEVKVYFIQVASSTLSQWIESETISRIETSDGLMLGYISDFSKVLAANPSTTKVLKADPFPLVMDQVFVTKIELPRTSEVRARQVAGATQPQATPISALTRLDTISEDSVAGQLEVALDSENRFPINFELSSGNSIVLTGFANAKTPEKTPETELIVVISLKK